MKAHVLTPYISNLGASWGRRSALVSGHFTPAPIDKETGWASQPV